MRSSWVLRSEPLNIVWFFENERRELNAQATLRRAWYLEMLRSKGAPSVEVFSRRLALRPSTPKSRVWLAFGAVGQVMAGGWLRPPEFDGLPAFELYVVPEFRGQGVARILANAIIETAASEAIGVVSAMTFSTGSVSEVSLRTSGAALLRTVAVTNTHLAPCQDNTETLAEVAEGIELNVFADPCPDEVILADIARLRRTVVGRYGSFATSAMTSKLVGEARSYEKSLARLEFEHWTTAAIWRGRCIAYSDYLWDAHEPELLVHQGLAVGEVPKQDVELLGWLIGARRRIQVQRPSIQYLRHSMPHRQSKMPKIHDPQNGETIIERRWAVAVEALRQFFIGPH